MHKILITDGMSKAAIEDLKKSAYLVDEKFYESEELCNVINNYDVVVVRSATKIKDIHIDKASNLKLIIRGGVGVDNIDVNYAQSKGISVRNTPGASADSVAELALAHMFSIARFIPASKITMSNAKWEKKKYTGTELGGKNIGIIGMGRIGKALANKCFALNMNVYYYDVFEVPDLNKNFKKTSLEEIYNNCDYISLHVPIKKGDPAIIGEKEINKMKDGVCIINCARGGVVDETALLNALNSGKVKAAGLDVYTEEPTNNIALTSHLNVSATPHIGAQTIEAQDRIGSEVVEIIKGFFEK